MKDNRVHRTAQPLPRPPDHPGGGRPARSGGAAQSRPLRIYREYCQMHKACTLLAADFATEAPGWRPTSNPSRAAGETSSRSAPV